jgi:hypothetical protein
VPVVNYFGIVVVQLVRTVMGVTRDWAVALTRNRFPSFVTANYT